MGILNILIIILAVAFPIAELARFQFGSIAFTLNDLLLAAVFFAWILRNKGKLKVNGILKKPILIFSLIGFISLTINLYWLSPQYFAVSLLYLLRFLLYSSIYFILIGQDKKFIDRFKNILYIPITALILGSYIQFVFYQSLRNLWYLGWDEHLYRLFAGFLDPNFAGAILVMTLMYLVYFAWQTFQTKEKFKFTLSAILAILNFLAVYLTYSRSALIMLAIVFVTFLILIGRKKMILALIAVSIITLIFAPKSFQTEGTNLFRIESSIHRIHSAQAALVIINKNPLIGVGFNAYRYAMNRYGIATDAIWQTTHSGAGTDNSFLFVWATTGIIGLASFIYLLFKIFSLALAKSKENKFGFVLISVLLGLIANSLFVNSLFFPYVLELIFIYAAITESN